MNRPIVNTLWVTNAARIPADIANQRVHVAVSQSELTALAARPDLDEAAFTTLSQHPNAAIRAAAAANSALPDTIRLRWLHTETTYKVLSRLLSSPTPPDQLIHLATDTSVSPQHHDARLHALCDTRLKSGLVDHAAARAALLDELLTQWTGDGKDTIGTTLCWLLTNGHDPRTTPIDPDIAAAAISTCLAGPRTVSPDQSSPEATIIRALLTHPDIRSRVTTPPGSAGHTTVHATLTAFLRTTTATGTVIGDLADHTDPVWTLLTADPHTGTHDLDAAVRAHLDDDARRDAYAVAEQVWTLVVSNPTVTWQWLTTAGATLADATSTRATFLTAVLARLSATPDQIPPILSALIDRHPDHGRQQDTYEELGHALDRAARAACLLQSTSARAQAAWRSVWQWYVTTGMDRADTPRERPWRVGAAHGWAAYTWPDLCPLSQVVDTHGAAMNAGSLWLTVRLHELEQAHGPMVTAVADTLLNNPDILSHVRTVADLADTVATTVHQPTLTPAPPDAAPPAAAVRVPPRQRTGARGHEVGPTL